MKKQEIKNACKEKGLTNEEYIIISEFLYLSELDDNDLPKDLNEVVERVCQELVDSMNENQGKYIDVIACIEYYNKVAVAVRKLQK